MGHYIIKRLLLVPIGVLGITLLTFLFVNLAPGGPVEQKLQQIRFGKVSKGNPIAQGGGTGTSMSRGSGTVSQEVIDALNKQYGFDKPLWERYWIWLGKIARMDFGKSFVYERPALDVILERIPVSAQFGIASFILTYLIAIPLGLLMAFYSNRPLDSGLRFGLLATSALPSFIIAILLIIFFAGGSFLDLFPLGYMTSENYDELSWTGKILDRLHHFVLPLLCYMLGAFTGLAFLTRNSVLQEVDKDYIRTAYAQGLSRTKIYTRHAFRNALIPVLTGIGGFLGVFLAGSMLIETIFNLQGIGLLGYSSIITRDYNIIMALAFLQSLILLFGNLISDLIYAFVDPRVHFEGSPRGGA